MEYILHLRLIIYLICIEIIKLSCNFVVNYAENKDNVDFEVNINNNSFVFFEGLKQKYNFQPEIYNITPTVIHEH